MQQLAVSLRIRSLAILIMQQLALHTEKVLQINFTF
jgi:hypothetical protein